MLLLFSEIYIIITPVKRIYPSKNFFYKINNPLLIYFTPLEEALLLPNRAFSHCVKYDKIAENQVIPQGGRYG